MSRADIDQQGGERGVCLKWGAYTALDTVSDRTHAAMHTPFSRCGTVLKYVVVHNDSVWGVQSGAMGSWLD